MEHQPMIAKTELESGLLLDFAQIKMDRLTFLVRQELDQIPLEELDHLIKAFTEVGSRPDEVLFLKSLVALKMTKKNLEVNHFFNRQLRPSRGTTIEQEPK